ncbi:MAG: hypothetical protein A2266_04035 [Bacteroidetes bacterium RIFOXYA12_FULL_40_10]|nr:MAG: hypothetical protein A2266_04035 [Bacteroidetes bacterium RIFOXYA12_FULL_40_10]
MRRLKVTYYDKIVDFKENLGFLKRLFNSGKHGLLISVIFIGILIGLDIGAREIASWLSLSTNSTLNQIEDFLYNVNGFIGIKYLDYFKDVIVIVAGVLGVILGLFFTTFLNIITSKYSNINSTIISQLLEQKIINRYFKLLAILVSSSIIFQFLLVIGYNPTFISAFIFSLIVIIALLSFLFFGRYSLIYFNAGNLVFDLINLNNQILNRVYKNKKHFNSKNNGKHTLTRVIRNINKIRIIVEESTKPQLSNTALDSISDELLKFSIRFNSFKHTFPSNKEWHPKTQKYKRWDEASSSEYEMYGRIGASLYPETVDDFLYIEKQIIDTQFFIFKNLSPEDKVKITFNQVKYLQIISFQCDEELFETFFNQLELFVIENLKTKEDDKSIETNLQLISLYANLIIQYLVGFNYNLERIINETQLRKLSKAIHFREDTDTIMQFPYRIRVWLDNYQSKLQSEVLNEKKVVTPLFYTEFEISYQFQLLLKNYFEGLTNNIHKRIQSFSTYLKSMNYPLETLEFLSESLESLKKIEFFSGILKNKIENDINALNHKKEAKYIFKEREDIILKNEKLQKNTINKIWEVGYSSYSVDNKELPDLFGNFYQLISQDILDKSFEDETSGLIKYLPQFYTYNVLYIDSLRLKIDTKRIEYTSSKLFPVLVDLFEISAITIILFKLTNNKELEDCFFDYWNKAFKDDKEEFNFWKMLIPIYQYFNQPLLGLSTPSYVREHERRIRLEGYLKKSDLVKFVEEADSRGFHIPEKYYKTDCEDIFIKEIVRNLKSDGLGFDYEELADIFIEYYLRTRISLKELEIKETNYGSELRRNMERNSE